MSENQKENISTKFLFPLQDENLTRLAEMRANYKKGKALNSGTEKK